MNRTIDMPARVLAPVLAHVLVLVALLCMPAQSASAQCAGSRDTIDLSTDTPVLESGQVLTIEAVDPDAWPRVTPTRYQLFLDGSPITPLHIGSNSITMLIPVITSEGDHTVELCIIDGSYGAVPFSVFSAGDTLDQDVDGTNPDPRTQNGPRQDLSGAGRRPRDYQWRSNRPGGRGGTLPCRERHQIDGRFTPLPGHQAEWAGISPMIGRFSNLYLDFCPDTKTMYLMNDWLLGAGQYQSNCYNVFGFTTGNGAEAWLIKVTHDSLRPIIVELNGADVTDDTSIVLGGAFAIGPSPSDTTPHTMYEFGVRASTGLFVMPVGDDPVMYVPSTTTALECDKDGIDRYGLIREPHVRLAVFSDEGSRVRQTERYIPTSGVVGLEVEPNILSGSIHPDSMQYRSGSQGAVSSRCEGVVVVDGAYTDDEWNATPPATGMFSDIYAKYCSGTLHILNDWVHANRMPDNATCYNLFELYTGNGQEHWGIWVWQDPTRRPKVVRNGVDVSDDTTIVHAGVAGWGSSPRKAEPHALYEFTISAMEGGFMMMFADPGPSSFCSLEPTGVDHSSESPNTGAPYRIFPNPLSTNDALTVTGVAPGDYVAIYDLHGRAITAPIQAQGASLSLPVPLLPLRASTGMYMIRIIHNGGVTEVPLVVAE